MNPPPEGIHDAAPPLVHVTDTDLEISRPVGSPVSSTTSLERRMLSDDQQQSYTAQDLQNKIDERFFAATPETTTDSRTDCEMNTSQVDSSAIEELPLKRDSRKGGKKAQPGQGKFQQAIKNQAGKFKTQMQKIKKPNISLPTKQTFEKFKIEKPKLNLPKIPDTTVIHLPTFSIKRKHITKKETIRQRQFSTESNDGEAPKKPLFNFGTYPRIFKKKPPKEDPTGSLSSKSHEPTPPVEFATVPRTAAKKEAFASKWAQKFSRNHQNDGSKKNKNEDRWGGSDTIRIPLHSEDSLDKQENVELSSVENDEGDVSHTRFNEDIDITDAYEKENQAIHRASPFSSNYNSRWNHGTFHGDQPEEYDEDFIRQRNYTVTDLDNDLPEAQTPPSDSFDINANKDASHSSASSLGQHRRGVLEEINSDEFFLRQKGISQDNIDVGMYLSSEIREAFMSPTNALSQMHQDQRYYDIHTSNQSLPEKKEKRTPIKKPKRKKTPHVSHEQIEADMDGEINEPNEYPKALPPIRPNRKGKKEKKSKENENVIPYQETIPLDSEENLNSVTQNDLDLKYFDDNEAEEYPEMYENEQMTGKQQPAIQVTDPYSESIFKYKTYENTKEIHLDEQENIEEQNKPAAPPRKHKSLKSLSFSEHDSIMGDFGDESYDVSATYINNNTELFLFNVLH